MGKRIYVGGLSYQTTKEELEQLFSEVGAVESATVVTDRETGDSKGFGFVEMTTEENAMAAITKYGTGEFEFMGRKLTVNEARPKEDRPAGGGGYSSNRGGGGSRY